MTDAAARTQKTREAAAPGRGVRVDVYLRDGALASLAEDVRTGLSAKPKTLPPKYFYDERGSRLFEQITRLPEYYPTRAEQAILERVAPEIVEDTRPQELVELGPGSSRKTHALLDPMLAEERCTYVPVDVSESAVREAAERLTDRYGELAIHAVVGDFERHFDRVPHNGRRRLIAFLGGTIGNLDALGRRAMLRGLRAQLGRDDRLLVGTDLVKDSSRLEAAYNDSAGVTADFNRNILRVVNANLDGELRPERFDHVAFYDRARSRVEMRLRAQEAHTALIRSLDMKVQFERGEDIRTEISCKFTRTAMEREYAAAGLDMVSWHTDEERLFALSVAGPR